jgi:predicted ATPase/class 3 adenylate cyclase
MTFEEVLDQAIDMLRRRGRLTYRALKRQFNLDDAYLEDLKEELIKAERVARDDEGDVLVWIGDHEQTTEQPPAITAKPTTRKAKVTRRARSPKAQKSAGPRRSVVAKRGRPEAERRQLTVEFIDLVGSTALSEQLDPEEYREVVQAYQAACGEITSRYDGHIAQYLGDGILVYFGYPVAHEDDAARAVRTGLEIVGAMQALSLPNIQLPQPVQVRVGIHTGPVVVGDIGGGSKREQLALGGTPNVAARVQGKAQPNTVVISTATYRLVQGLFECQDRGPHELKGVQTPLQLYRVVGAGEAQSRFEVAVSRGLTPLVGREEEVALLRRHWARAKEREGQVVLLSGEPGIGKSRLAQVLKEHVAQEGAIRIEFRCSPYHQNTAFYPIIEHLQRLLGFEENETPQSKLTKLAKTLASYRFPQADTIPLLAALLSLPHPEGSPPLNLSPQRQKQKTQDALVAWLVEDSEKRAVYNPWEDIHWADPSSLEFLTLLIDQAPTARLYLLLTFRPEFTPPWGGHSYISLLTLSRLGRNQVPEMIGKIAGGTLLPAEVIQQIVAKTDGVPLFVEELTKAVMESVESRGTQSGMALQAISIPATLHDSLMARLDRLGAAKEIAQVGAVLGREFSYELLHVVSSVDEERLQQGLKQVVAAGLVYQRGLPPQAIYLFKHALTRDVAYNSLLLASRRRLHQQIGEAIFTRHGDNLEEWASLLAHHFAHSENASQALPYLVQTGERAQRVYANAEAVRAFTQGLEILDTLPPTEATRHQRTDLVLRLASLHALLGHYSESLALYTRVAEGAQAAGDTKATAQLETRIGRVRYSMGDHDNAIACFQRALDLAQRANDTTRMAVCYQSLGDVYLSSGSLPRAIESFMSALRISEAADNQAGIAAAYTFLSNAHARAGNLEAAIQCGRRALELSEQLQDDRRMAWACIMLAQACYFSGDFADVPALSDRARQLCEKVGDFQGITWVYVLQGNLRAARDKDFETALAYSERGRRMGQESGGLQHMVSARFAHEAEWLLRLGRYREAFEYCQQSLEISLQASNKLEYGHAYMVLAEIHASEAYRDWDKAAWYLEESLKAFREVGGQVYVGQVHLAGARIAVRRQDGSARQWAEKARDIFVERGAKALLQEVETLLEELGVENRC